ncbi:MAG: starvation-sensing protein RspA, partial [Actinobacteria bacterium]|nr:starvation-sensing protein RspA [Actinomycetota bacterium]NIS31795.1 starvation-sensing protein RspA [Actinomycetota bacterium]NIT94796.1 starvation-sensing protein RspA [Actinomycetota bacterium]NIU18464.1 starvation-sensing protein RspA [Actinomycetota bacterium]NIU66887.1 starvation-sensing protein RspA [Actinomycetota bacterium]
MLDKVERYRAEGHRAVRCQMGGYGGAGDRVAATATVEDRYPGAYYDPDRYARSVVDLFDHVRSGVGDDL